MDSFKLSSRQAHPFQQAITFCKRALCQLIFCFEFRVQVKIENSIEWPCSTAW